MFRFHAIAFLLCFVTSLTAEVDNSIIPTIETYERIESLNPKKYSKAQFNEISSALSRYNERIRAVSYNILFDLYDHNLAEEYRWPQRLPRLVEILEDMQPDLIGVQELYHRQLQGVMPLLEPTYAFYCKPETDGELNGIFYRKERFEVVDSQVFEMTPGSTLTMLKLKDLKNGLCIAVFNTHLAFRNIEKREQQARYIATHIRSHSDGLPIILMGDLNTFPHRLQLDKLPFYDGDYIHRILAKAGIQDAVGVSIVGHLGPLSTSTFSEDGDRPFEGTGSPGILMDHIYVSDGIEVLMHAIQPATVNGLFPSDHLPVIADIVIKYN